MSLTDGLNNGYGTTSHVDEYVGDGSTLTYKATVEASDVTSVECWESGAWAAKTITTEWDHDTPANDTITVTFVDSNEPSASVAGVYTVTYPAKASVVAGDFHTITTQDGETYAVWFRTVAGVAQIETFTFEAKASCDDGDFIVFNNAAGDVFAAGLDLTGSSAEPTATEWTSIDSDNKVFVDISLTTDAASVAAAVEAGIATIVNLAGLSTDDTAADGTLTITNDNTGACVDGLSYQDDGSASDITVAVGTNGVTATAAPTSSVFTALDSGVVAMADISGATDAASVAAVAETSWDGISGFTAKCVTDDSAADGTMTFTMQTAGDVSDPTDYAAASITDGSSSIDWAETTEGKTTTCRITFTQASSTMVDLLNNGL